MMQNFLDLEERLKDLTTDLQTLKEAFASTVVNGSSVRSPEYSKHKDRSFFNMLHVNGRSKNTETIL